jgi:hypothetical protein
MKWLVVGFIANFGTTLNASRIEMQPLVDNLVRIFGIHFSEAGGMDPEFTEVNLYEEDHKVYGVAAIRLVPEQGQVALSQFVQQGRPNDQMTIVARSIADAMWTKDQSWFGVERYIGELSVKIGKFWSGPDMCQFKQAVKGCLHEQFESTLPGLAHHVVQSASNQQLLPDSVATAIAVNARRVNYKNDSLTRWIHRTYAASVNPGTSDSEVQDRCRNCVSQVQGLLAQLGNNDTLPLMYPIMRYPCISTKLASSTARLMIWSMFLCQDCPQMSQQGWGWPNVPSEWPFGWWETWDDVFVNTLVAIMRRFAPDQVRNAIRNGMPTLRGALPMTCPPELIMAYKQTRPTWPDPRQLKPALYQAWMEAWKQTCSQSK